MKYTWPQAARAWCEAKKDNRSIKGSIAKFRYLLPLLGHLQLNAIKRTHIREIVQKRLQEGCKPGTVNNMLVLIKSVLRFARDELEWIDQIPVIKLQRNNNHREIVLSREHVIRLYDELPLHLQPIMEMALATGQRMSNVCQMQWEDVNERMWSIPAHKSKNGEKINVHLNARAMGILLLILKPNDQSPLNYVFSYKGRPIKKANGPAWRKAKKRAGLEHVHFHDLRHTWASRHVEAETPLHILQKLGGWKSFNSMKRYAHPSEEQLKKAAENIV